MRTPLILEQFRQVMKSRSGLRVISIFASFEYVCLCAVCVLFGISGAEGRLVRFVVLVFVVVPRDSSSSFVFLSFFHSLFLLDKVPINYIRPR